MEIYMLQSGSAGNCCVIKTSKANIMIDVGITYSEIVKRMDKHNLCMDDIDAVLITHEHIDHIKSIRMIDETKIYATDETLKLFNFHRINPYVDFNIKGLKITPLSISHDIKNGLGFILEDDNERLLYMTDTGYIKKDALALMKDFDHIILESNYDNECLEYSNRPAILKNRIASRRGHLSNYQCAEYLCKIVSPRTRTIMLAHISGECNSKELAVKTLKEVFDEQGIDYSNVKIIGCERTKETESIK